jgi:hypothetical protein
MTIAGKTGLVTGANRGIGQALVAEALSRAPRGSMPAPANPWPTPTPASPP